MTQTYGNDALPMLGVELMKGNDSHFSTFSTSGKTQRHFCIRAFASSILKRPCHYVAEWF